MWDLALPVAIGVTVILVIGLMFARLYRRSTRDEAYVRTGLGGQKVVLDGGSVVLPIFHSTAAVNLKTLRLEVTRGGPDSLITKDRMRVDIGAEFYLRVKPDTSSIALAAQTLGNRTNDAAELRELIEAKFVDGLRSVAATMNMEELQEQRATFVKSVQDAVGADIQNNGLELESVSLTRLDQSDIRHFNPSNFFDAHGLTTLTKITKEREQERNQIVRTTEVNIAQQDLVARQTTLTIESTKREAELAQQRDIANKTAAMRAQTAQVEQTALQNEAEYRIQQELAVANKQTEANQAKDTRKIEAAVKPIEKISDIRIFDTGSLLGRGGNGANGHGGNGGLGLGDGLASQLLSVSAFKPIIDKILTEAGFAAGPDALTSLTNALAAKQLAGPAELPSAAYSVTVASASDAAPSKPAPGAKSPSK
jgi:flotillin